MRWFKIAAAAIVIGLIVLVYFATITNKVTQQNSFANQTTILKNKATLLVPKVEVTLPATQLNILPNNTAIVTIKATNKVLRNTAIVANTLTKAPVIKADFRQGYKPNAIDNLQNSKQQNEAVVVTNPEVNRTTNNPLKNTIVDEPMVIPTTTNIVAVNAKANTATQQVIYKELDTNDEEKSLLVGSIEINKDKLRGFLRKASKLFGNKQKNDDDKPLVALK